MHAVTGKVVGGKIVVEGLALPEGTTVTVFTRDEESVVELPPALKKELLAAIDEADGDDGGAGMGFLESLRRRG